MSTYSCSKKYSGSSVKHTLHNSDDESAARTRPFSFEDIMLRRKNKGSAADAEGGSRDATNQLGREVIDKDITFHRESEAEGKSRSSRRSSRGVQHQSLEKPAKISSRRKKEERLLKDDMEVRRSHRDNHESGSTLMAKLKYDANGKDKGQKNDRENLVQGKKDKRSRTDIENESGKKHSRDEVGKNRHEDRGRGKHESESKRNYQNGGGDRNRDKNSTKKHDHGKHHELENRERKETRVSSSSHYEESRFKRRRNRSQDRENKHRRTVSLSPRARKHSTKLERQEELPLDSHIKKSERRRSDNDKTGDSTNGSSSQYRRHSGSTSGLGGYSPRKRRTESSIKTPPPVLSPDKKNAGWDLLPAAKVGLFSGSVHSSKQPSYHSVSSRINDLSTAAPVSPAMRKLTSGVSSYNLATKTKVSLDQIQLTQATRPLRRLYIENLPHSASEKAIIDSLNNFLTSSGVNHIEGAQPCISCIIHKDKGQALVEFLTPEYASVALSFDGSYFSGSILKIRRPKDFVEIVTGDLDKSVVAVNTISDSVEDSPNKIFIAGISNTISSKMLRDIVTAFGPLKAYHVGMNEDLNEICAVLEYVDQSVMPKACAGLNGMKIGGQVLKVFPTVPFSSSSEHQGCQLPEHVRPLLQQPTVVLKFNNVFNAEVLPILSESDIDEILEDIRIECARFGAVKSINIVKCCNNFVNAKEEYKDTDDVEIKHEFQGSLDNCANDGEFQDVNNLEDDKVNLVNCTDDDRRPNEVSEDKLCQMGNDDVIVFEDLDCKNMSDRTPQGLPKQLSSPANKFELHDAEAAAEIIETDENSLDNKSQSLDDSTMLKADDDSEKLDVLYELDIMVRSDSDTFEKSKEKDLNNDLESEFALGSVFVEYGRIEASSMAAHSLNGRVYDGREISIEYVSLDLYRTRFPK